MQFIATVEVPFTGSEEVSRCGTGMTMRVKTTKLKEGDVVLQDSCSEGTVMVLRKWRNIDCTIVGFPTASVVAK